MAFWSNLLTQFIFKNVNSTKQTCIAKQLHCGGRTSQGRTAEDIRSLRSFIAKCKTRKYLTLKMKVNFLEYNIRSGKYVTANAAAIVIFALSLIIYKIFANQLNANIFTLKMKVKEKNGTCAIRLEMSDSI